jgi:hypothetical protein
MKESLMAQMGAHRRIKERRLGQPSISKCDGWEAVTPWEA